MAVRSTPLSVKLRCKADENKSVSCKYFEKWDNVSSAVKSSCTWQPTLVTSSLLVSVDVGEIFYPNISKMCCMVLHSWDEALQIALIPRPSLWCCLTLQPLFSSGSSKLLIQEVKYRSTTFQQDTSCAICNLCVSSLYRYGLVSHLMFKNRSCSKQELKIVLLQWPLEFAIISSEGALYVIMT